MTSYVNVGATVFYYSRVYCITVDSCRGRSRFYCHECSRLYCRECYVVSKAQHRTEKKGGAPELSTAFVLANITLVKKSRATAASQCARSWKTCFACRRLDLLCCCFCMKKKINKNFKINHMIIWHDLTLRPGTWSGWVPFDRKLECLIISMYPNAQYVYPTYGWSGPRDRTYRYAGWPRGTWRSLYPPVSLGGEKKRTII